MVIEHWKEAKEKTPFLLRTYPNATAAAIAKPSAADLPRPRAAVKATVVRKVFSEIASTNFKTALAWKSTKRNIWI